MNLNHKIRILQVLLICSVTLFAASVSGLVYVLVSNHAKVSFSFNGGSPIQVQLIPGTTNITAANFTVKALSTSSTIMNNLWINVTIDSHPNSTGTSFRLNGVIALNQQNPQWIMDPFSLNPNQAQSFNFTFTYSGVFGFYDIDTTVLQSH